MVWHKVQCWDHYYFFYINDLNQAIVHSKVHNFADDTNFLHASHSLKRINKTINFDLSNLFQWLIANKISVNVSKTELVIFISPKKQIYKNLNFGLSRQNIEPKHHTNYLEVILDKHLSFNEYMNRLKQKLNRESCILAEPRYYMSADILKTIYYALFDLHMRYSCQIWGQSHSKTFDMIQSVQSKTLRIINFKQSMEPSEPLYQNLKINKLKNNIILNNCLFVFDKLTNNLPDEFDQFFQPFKEQHNYNTRGS